MYPLMRIFKTPPMNNTFSLKVTALVSFQRRPSLPKRWYIFLQYLYNKSKSVSLSKVGNAPESSWYETLSEHKGLSESRGLSSIDAAKISVFMLSRVSSPVEEPAETRSIFFVRLSNTCFSLAPSMDIDDTLPHFQHVWSVAKFSEVTNPTKLYAACSGKRFQTETGIRSKRSVEKLSHRPSI